MIQSLLDFYEKMYRIRYFENRLGDLILAKEINTPCHLYVGQEAVAVGVCSNLNDKDLIWGNHRSHGHYLAKGGESYPLMAEIFGKETGCSKGRGGSMHIIAKEVGILGTVPIVAGTIPLAVGAGLKSKIKGDGTISVAFFGDGAIEEGHVHESINLAAILNLPVLFICENNFYSSHLHLLERRKRDNISSIGDYHGIESHVINGNNVEEVYQTVGSVVEQIRNGAGPAFIEARTFRWRGHVGASFDEDVGVTRKEDLDKWIKLDPIQACKDKLLLQGSSEEEIRAIEQQVHQEIEEAIQRSREDSYPESSRVTRFVFS